MTEAVAVDTAQIHATAGAAAPLSPASAEGGIMRMPGSRQRPAARAMVLLDEIKDALRQEPVMGAHLMNGTSPFGADIPVTPGWQQDGEALAQHLTRSLNALQDDENGITIVIACAGAYQKGLMDHLMIWNVCRADGKLKLQTGNHENIGGRHYPTAKVDTAELWQALDPTGSKNSNAPGAPIDTFAKTPLGISIAKYGMFINLFPATASENFDAAMAMLSATEAGQKFGFLDGQKSCFTTARDLLGATRTKGPRGETVDWEAGKPQPVVPEILNKLSLLTNNVRQIGVEAAQGRLYDLKEPGVREEVARDKAVFTELSAKIAGWINKNPGAYQLTIRPALHAH